MAAVVDRARILAALVLAACCAAALAAEQAPQFDRYIAIEPETVAPGKVAGLIRNIGTTTVRNVVLRVRHRWSWAGGSYRHTDETIVSQLVLPGDPAGFAAVHIPPAHVPPDARYDNDIAVIELSQIRLAPE